MKQEMGAVFIKQIKGKFNNVHVITAYRDKSIIITNIQENRLILNHIKHTKTIVYRMISLSTKPLTPDHIGDFVKSTS